MIVLYTLNGCPYCLKALNLLKKHKIKYENIEVENNENTKKKYKESMNMTTFPMIFLKLDENTYSKIGGSSDLESYINKCIELSNNELSIDNIYQIYKSIYNK